jgi:hypothetical protein
VKHRVYYYIAILVFCTTNIYSTNIIDGRDTMQNKLASGVCFAKVNTLLGQSSSTKLTLK